MNNDEAPPLEQAMPTNEVPKSHKSPSPLKSQETFPKF